MLAGTSNSFYRTALILIYCVILTGISIYSFKSPEYNWDMLPYMGVVVSYDGNNANSIHEKVYITAKEEVPPTLYRQLTDPNNTYRTAAEEDADAFYNQLPFYVVKPLYTWSAYLFYKAGASLTRSTVLPSVISYFMMGLLLFYWLQKYWPPSFAFSAAMVTIISPAMLSVAKLSTPDALSGLLLFTAVFSIIEKKSFVFTSIILLLTIFARIDNIIPALFILSTIYFSNRRNEKTGLLKYISVLIGMILSYFFISSNAQSFGWDMLYYTSFVKQLNPSYQLNEAVVFKDYASLAKSQVMTGLLYSSVCFFLLFVLLLFAGSPIPRFNDWNMEQILSVAFLLTMITRFVLQPLIADRIYIAYYLSMVAFVVKKYSFVTHVQSYKR